MDETRKYLFEHRDELDVEKPPRPQVWKQIQKQTGAAKKPVIPIMIRWVAAACILAFVTFLIVRLQGSKGTVGPEVVEAPKTQVKDSELVTKVDPQPGATTQVMNEDSNQSPHIHAPKENNAPVQLAVRPKSVKPSVVEATLSPFEAMEDNYTSIISYQLKKVEKTPIYAEDAGYFHVFKKQWLDLQKDERKVKQDLNLYEMNDEMVSQLIRLYQQKLKLLKELQAEINKMNIRARQHPGPQRKNPAYLKL